LKASFYAVFVCAQSNLATFKKDRTVVVWIDELAAPVKSIFIAGDETCSVTED